MNKLKNEYEVKLGEKVILLRPTFEALANVEGSLGSLAYLAWKFAASRNSPKHSIAFTDLCQIIYLCQAGKNREDANKPEYSLEDIWELMQSHGAFKVLSDITIFISMVTAGDRTAPDLSEAVKKN